MTRKITYTIINSKGEVEHKEKVVKEKKKTFKMPKYVDVGFYLIIPLLLAVFLGRYLDQKFETKSLFTILLIIFGTIATFYNLIKISNDATRSHIDRNG